MPQTAEQLQAARVLAAEYGLTGADFYQHKQSKSFLISRTGIEKIQYKAGIEVGFDAEKIELEFAAVKATASRKVKAEGKATATKLTIQTFGSASKANCQVSYYLEMAEKRALSRAVLKLTDFYQLGVYGEDEMPPVSFRAEVPAAAPAQLPATVLAPVAAEPAPVMHAETTAPAPEEPAAVVFASDEQREKITKLLDHPLIERGEKTKMLLNIYRLTPERADQAITKLEKAIANREEQALATGNEHMLVAGNEPAGQMPAAQPSAAPAASTTSGLNVAGPAEIPAEVLAKFTSKFEAAASGIDVENLWKPLTQNEQAALLPAKEAAKARLATAARLANEIAQRTTGMKEAGTSSELVDEFIDQPLSQDVNPVEYATKEQKEAIQRLLDHPKITRREKTLLLVHINKLDKERARQALLKLRRAIGKREGVNPIDGARGAVKAFVLRHQGQLSVNQADELNALADSPEATLEFLLDAVELAQGALADEAPTAKLAA